MMRFTHKLGSKALLRIAALATAGVALSACTYDMGLGYASDGYGGGYYDCDPYSPFDSYYDCDNRYGFFNIGYGGGWYHDYWYPGYGFFLFDNYGRRYSMRDHDRRYWGERRHSWYRENRGRHHGGRHQDGRGSGYSDNGSTAPTGWSERNGGRIRDRDHTGDSDTRNRSDGRRYRNRGWQGGNGNGANAIPTPTPEATGGEGYGRGDGRRIRGGERPAWNGNDGAGGAVQAPRADRPAGRLSGRQDGAGRQYRQPAPASDYGSQSTPQSSAPAPVAQPNAASSEEPRHGRGNGLRGGRHHGRQSPETQPD